MIIGLLLVMAAIAGSLCVWLLLRRNAASATAAAKAAPQAMQSATSAASTTQRSAMPDERLLEGAALTDQQAFRLMYELAFGVQAREQPPQQELQVVSENAAEVFGRLATDPKYAMRRPMMLPQLLRAVHDRKSTQHQLANIFARDPALAGNLLKVANSPMYRVSQEPIESLDRAVALLGTDGLHSLIATALLQPVFKLAETRYPRCPEIVWEHTFRAAVAAEWHASQIERDDPFAAQLLALTMGLGVIVIYRIVIDRSRELLDGRSPHPAVVMALLDAQCASVARRVAASWELSERVLTALEEQRPGGVPEGSRMLSPLGRSLAFGRKLAALAVLHEHGRVSEDTVRASMALEGPLSDQFHNIWAKLIGNAGRLQV